MVVKNEQNGNSMTQNNTGKTAFITGAARNVGQTIACNGGMET